MSDQNKLNRTIGYKNSSTVGHDGHGHGHDGHGHEHSDHGAHHGDHHDHDDHGSHSNLSPPPPPPTSLKRKKLKKRKTNVITNNLKKSMQMIRSKFRSKKTKKIARSVEEIVDVLENNVSFTNVLTSNQIRKIAKKTAQNPEVQSFTIHKNDLFTVDKFVDVDIHPKNNLVMKEQGTDYKKGDMLKTKDGNWEICVTQVNAVGGIIEFKETKCDAKYNDLKKCGTDSSNLSAHGGHSHGGHSDHDGHGHSHKHTNKFERERELELFIVKKEGVTNVPLALISADRKNKKSTNAIVTGPLFLLIKKSKKNKIEDGLVGRFCCHENVDELCNAVSEPESDTTDGDTKKNKLYCVLTVEDFKAALGSSLE